LCLGAKAADLASGGEPARALPIPGEDPKTLARRHEEPAIGQELQPSRRSMAHGKSAETSIQPEPIIDLAQAIRIITPCLRWLSSALGSDSNPGDRCADAPLAQKGAARNLSGWFHAAEVKGNAGRRVSLFIVRQG
jgi:hypothetical protein